MTWSEVERAVAGGMTTCILPAASIEQHGPHLPLITDTALGGELAVRLARKLGDALVAPVIRPGMSDHHMDFAGSLTLPEEVFVAVLEACCRGLAHHGFTTLILFSSHGGNFYTLNQQAPRLQELLGGGVRVIAVADLNGFIEAQNRPLAARDIAPGHAGSHAGLAETSEMMVIRPDLVHESEFVAGYTGTVGDELFERGLRAYTANGILGDARGSRAEYGEAVLESLAEYLAEQVRQARGQ